MREFFTSKGGNINILSAAHMKLMPEIAPRDEVKNLSTLFAPHDGTSQKYAALQYTFLSSLAGQVDTASAAKLIATAIAGDMGKMLNWDRREPGDHITQERAGDVILSLLFALDNAPHTRIVFRDRSIAEVTSFVRDCIGKLRSERGIERPQQARLGNWFNPKDLRRVEDILTGQGDRTLESLLTRGDVWELPANRWRQQ